MDKLERQQKFLQEHPDFSFDSAHSISESVKKWRENYPERVTAHRLVFTAMRNGTLKKEPCFCGSKETEAHHKDYLQPLKVVWLCKKHHTIADKQRKLMEKVIHSRL